MIRLEHITKRFDGRAVLDDLSLDLTKGRSLAVLGRSGTGKSVLSRIALGLMVPDAGRVLVIDQPMSAKVRRDLMAKTGVLFQGAALFDGLTVAENVAFRLRNGPQRVSRLAARSQALAALERVGLEARVADLYPADLSGGMQKRVGLARAIVGAPEFLVFDEPNSGLDPVTAGEIDRLVRTLVTDLKATALTITHDMASVATIADEVLLLDRGRVRWHGPVAEMEGAEDALLGQFRARR
ncbi:MAG TPA: ABC transporter ATP-binding protein [Maritimibacter sp.]|nr:ABC transporter ATP-binding protein [Maritimibacter sp.]